MEKVKLCCSCNQVQGKLLINSFSEGNNITCMCDDCQCFAHFLGKEDEILNKNGGTKLFQLTPNKVEISQGKEYLSCMQLSPKGVKRWYTTCCQTPVANTISAKMAFNGIFHQFIDFECMEPDWLKSFGQFRNHCMGKFGKGNLPEKTSEKFPLGLTLKIASTLLLGKISKSYVPNSFFDIKTGMPISTPVIISKEERIKLKESLNS